VVRVGQHGRHVRVEFCPLECREQFVGEGDEAFRSEPPEQDEQSRVEVEYRRRRQYRVQQRVARVEGPLVDVGGDGTQQEEPRDAVGILGREVEGGRTTTRETDDHRPLDTQFVQQRDEQRRLCAG
jgi:hypothetical protein